MSQWLKQVPATWRPTSTGYYSKISQRFLKLNKKNAILKHIPNNTFVYLKIFINLCEQDIFGKYGLRRYKILYIFTNLKFYDYSYCRRYTYGENHISLLIDRSKQAVYILYIQPVKINTHTFHTPIYPDSVWKNIKELTLKSFPV